jgi:ABC-type Mn2+/Zn2+ transport system ATPase subunit
MPRPSDRKIDEVPAVSVRDVTVRYDDAAAIERVSFDVRIGEIAAVIGPNGSGKTTLLRAILGLVPYEGEILVLGGHVQEERGRIGYVPQRFEFDPRYPITVGEFMELGRHPSVPAGRIKEKIKEVGLVPAILGRRLGSLSGGQLQRVLVVDEPATGIDVVGEATFYDAIRHLNETHDTTVLMVSHDLAVVSKVVDRVICINRKLMCSGTPTQAMSPEVLSEVFGRHAAVYGHEGHSNPARAHQHGKKHGHGAS